MQRKYAIALGALFTSLIEGCVARVTAGSDEDSGDTSGSEGSTGDPSASSTSTSGPNSTSTSGPYTSSTTDPTVDPCEPFFSETTVEAALVAGYGLGEALPQELCTDLCTTELFYDEIQGCVLVDLDYEPDTSDGTTGGGGGTTGEDEGGPTGDATSVDPSGATTVGDTTGSDDTATIECTYVSYCGEGGRRSAGLVSRGDCECDDDVARWFASMAHSEAASVTSFLRLQDELARHGAPEELRARLWDAARDEVRHARAMRRLARGKGVEPKHPEHVKIDARDLEAIARENAVEGCVAETWSALLCAWQARHCKSPELAEIMREIAADETRHAELAWAIDAWARARLDEDARQRIDASRRDAAQRLVAMASELGGNGMREELGLPRPSAARTLASGLQAALWA